MPATSRNQRIAAAIALHHPSKLHASNRGMLKMTSTQLSDYASSVEKSARSHKRPKKHKK